jgi:hypothetical protein
LETSVRSPGTGGPHDELIQVALQPADRVAVEGVADVAGTLQELHRDRRAAGSAASARATTWMWCGMQARVGCSAGPVGLAQRVVLADDRARGPQEVLAPLGGHLGPSDRLLERGGTQPSLDLRDDLGHGAAAVVVARPGGQRLGGGRVRTMFGYGDEDSALPLIGSYIATGTA